MKLEIWVAESVFLSYIQNQKNGQSPPFNFNEFSSR